MRLFIAIDLEDDARRAVAAEQQRLGSAIGESRSSIRWVHADHLHLTIVFLGEVPEAQAKAVTATIARPVDAAPFQMILQGVGVFPNHGAPRAVWIAVTDGATEVVELQRDLARRVAAEGVSLESRPFQPHLTLGRWRRSRPSDRRRMLAVATPVVVARTTVSRATLYHSRLSSAGPTYTALAHANLSGG